MTEQEWLECAEPTRMLEFLRCKVSERKLRLFAVACCRQIWSLLVDDRSRKAVEIAEKFVDGMATADERQKAAENAHPVTMGCDTSRSGDSQLAAAYAPIYACESLNSELARFQDNGEYTAIDAALGTLVNCDDTEYPLLTIQLRCIVGNPFQSITLDRSRLTATALSIAQAIYEERAFDRLPILGDALEDAGCDNADILNHCRQPGEHVRGCWVIDLLLGKK